MVVKTGDVQIDFLTILSKTESKKLLNAALERLNEHMDWEAFRPILERYLGYKDQRKGGRIPWCPVLMLKVLILQKYYGLSDEQTEQQIRDRLSFMAFLGLRLGDDVPDQKTIWAFKERLGESCIRLLFDIFKEKLKTKNLIIKEGKIIDASFVEMPRQRNSRDENKDIKEGKRPEDFDKNPNRGRQKDTDARWVKKNKEKYYGYKNNIRIDAKSKLIDNYSVTNASVHDSQSLEGLFYPGDEGLTIWADSAYTGWKIQSFINSKASIGKINEKAQRNKPLTAAQKDLNRKKSKIRCRVEHVFGRTKQFSAHWFRRVGIQRAKFEIGMGNLLYNIDRYCMLMQRA